VIDTVNIIDPHVVDEARKRLEKYNDLLEAMWKEVENLSTQYTNNTDSKLWSRVDLSTKEGQMTVKWTVLCAVEELFELINAMKNRPWVQSEYLVDVNRLYDELADAIAFIIVLSYQLGLDPKKLADIVVRKVVVNEFRIRSKY